MTAVEHAVRSIEAVGIETVGLVTLSLLFGCSAVGDGGSMKKLLTYKRWLYTR